MVDRSDEEGLREGNGESWAVGNMALSGYWALQPSAFSLLCGLLVCLVSSTSVESMVTIVVIPVIPHHTASHFVSTIP